VDFAFSQDQQQLRTAVRRWLADRVPPERLAELADSPGGWDPTSWAELVGLGWVGLSAPDGGGGFLDEAVLLEEAGYAILPGPLLTTMVAAPALVAGGADPTRATALAWPAWLPAGAPAGPTAVATGAGGGWTVTGVLPDVPDLGAAQQAVVVAATGSGPGLFLVEPAGPTVDVRVLATTDATRRVGRLTLDATPAAPLSLGPATAGLVEAMRRRGWAALALEAVGVAQRALDLAAEHAKVREQFGRAIGSYQAVSHRVADVYVRTELARSLAYRAAWCVATAEQEPDAVTAAEVDVACASAKAAATEAAVFACEAAIQVLGGTGMTWDHVVHRYYKRALANESAAGSPAALRAVVAEHLLGAA